MSDSREIISLVRFPFLKTVLIDGHKHWTHLKHIGEAGIQSGAQIWRQYNAEHFPNPSNVYTPFSRPWLDTFQTFYDESIDGSIKARALLSFVYAKKCTRRILYGMHPPKKTVDTDPSTIENIEASNISETFYENGDGYVCGKENASSIWARGHC